MFQFHRIFYRTRVQVSGFLSLQLFPDLCKTVLVIDVSR
jgi:hypothetical protein